MNSSCCGDTTQHPPSCSTLMAAQDLPTLKNSFNMLTLEATLLLLSLFPCHQTPWRSPVHSCTSLCSRQYHLLSPHFPACGPAPHVPPGTLRAWGGPALLWVAFSWRAGSCVTSAELTQGRADPPEPDLSQSSVGRYFQRPNLGAGGGIPLGQRLLPFLKECLRLPFELCFQTSLRTTQMTIGLMAEGFPLLSMVHFNSQQFHLAEAPASLCYEPLFSTSKIHCTLTVQVRPLCWSLRRGHGGNIPTDSCCWAGCLTFGNLSFLIWEVAMAAPSPLGAYRNSVKYY